MLPRTESKLIGENFTSKEKKNILAILHNAEFGVLNNTALFSYS